MHHEGSPLLQQQTNALTISSSQISSEPSFFSRCAILIVFCLHNASNCWFFLNFTNFGPVKDLLNLTTNQVGNLTTFGWLGILLTLPIAILSTYPRTTLILAGITNISAVFLRYYTALAVATSSSSSSYNYPIMCLSNFLVGSCYGIIGTWPTVLATEHWRNEAIRPFVTAISSLANYTGGALAVVCIPFLAPDAMGLLWLFRMQVYFAMFLGVVTFAWLWIPPLRYQGGDENTILHTISITILRNNKKWIRLVLSGIFIGLSLLLQGMCQFILSEFGFTDEQAGWANCVYQASSAIVGISVSTRINDHIGIKRTLRTMILFGSYGYAAFACSGLYWKNRSDNAVVFGGSNDKTSGSNRSGLDFVLLLLIMAILGSCLMGALPLLLLECVHVVNETHDEDVVKESDEQVGVVVVVVGENIICGLIFIEAMLLAAGLTYVTTDESGMANVWIMGGVLGVGSVGMFVLDFGERTGGNGGGGGVRRGGIISK